MLARIGFEEKRGALIVPGQIDVLTPHDTVEHVLRAVPKTAERHVDERVVFRLKRHAHVHLEGTVGMLQNPVRAAWQNLALQAITLEPVSRDGGDPAASVGAIAQLNLVRSRPDKQIEQVSGFDLAHRLVSFIEYGSAMI